MKVGIIGAGTMGSGIAQALHKQTAMKLCSLILIWIFQKMEKIEFLNC